MHDDKNINTHELEDIAGHKILLNVTTSGEKITDWAARNHAYLEQLLQQHGALLVRGLKVMSSKQFGSVLEKIFSEELINYTYRSTPRTELKANIYTATEYHAEETIPQHNENAYSNQWPLRIGFVCMLPADSGGETPLADSRRVYQAIDPAVREEFAQRGVMYVRNYGDVDLPWTEVFQTDNKAVVEQFCNNNQIEYEWLDNNGLRTRQINAAIQRHPVSDELVWFNQAHLFHISNLNAETQASLLGAMGEEHLPRNSYFGDGGAISPDALTHIRQVYQDLQFAFAWQMHDLLLLDNMLFTHGRRPYTGTRKVLVGMARAHGGVN